MYVDQNLRLSGNFASPNVGQSITSGTIYSTNCVDLNSGTNVSGGTTTAQNRDIGEGQDLYVVCTVGTAFSGGTNVQVDVIVADDTALTTNTKVIGTFGTILTAALVNGAEFVARINPQIGTVGQRYLGVRYTVSGTYSAGTIFADVVSDIYDSKKFYAGGFTVS